MAVGGRSELWCGVMVRGQQLWSGGQTRSGGSGQEGKRRRQWGGTGRLLWVEWRRSESRRDIIYGVSKVTGWGLWWCAVGQEPHKPELGRGTPREQKRPENEEAAIIYHYNSRN